MKQEKPWFCQECRVQMEWNGDFEYLKCPECEIEVWLPDYDFNKEARKIAETADEVIIPIPRKGGGRSKGASRKHLLQKKSTQRLYEELCR